MIRGLFAQLFAKRFALEITLLMALIILCINEYTYRMTMSALRGGIALTDERIAVGQLLQALTDAETGQRGYLMTQDSSFLEPYKAALGALPKLRATVIPLLNSQNAISASQIDEIIDSRLGEMATTISLSESGSNQMALDIVKAGAGRDWMGQLRRIINTELANASNRQHHARVSIYDALAVNRAAVIFLTLSSVVALYVFIRQLRLQERERVMTQATLVTAVEQRTLELRDLTRHLQTVREGEKDRLARELHDELGALLTVAKLDLEGLRKRVETTPDLTTRVMRVSSRINEVIVLKRRLVEDMRPSSLTMLGLRSALEQHCLDIAQTLDIPFNVNIAEVSLPPETELVIFRFVQEALTNVAKYSKAKNVWVELIKKENTLEIVIRDDGVGFDQNLALAGRHGLTGMRYRIDSIEGVMTVTSKPGEGTTVKAVITS